MKTEKAQKKAVRAAKSAEKEIKKNSPKSLKLLVTVVNRSKAEFFADLIQQYSVNMQMLCAAQGTASSEMLTYLGLGATDKAVIFSVVREDNVKEINEMLEEKFDTVRNGRGIAFTVPFSSVIGVLTYGFLSDNRMTVKEDKQ